MVSGRADPPCRTGKLGFAQVTQASATRGACLVAERNPHRRAYHPHLGPPLHGGNVGDHGRWMPALLRTLRDPDLNPNADLKTTLIHPHIMCEVRVPF